MINLHGKISVKNMSGFLNVVPTTGTAMLQVKRVEPTYEEQEVVPDVEDGYVGLSKVIVGPKDRPLIEVTATDKIANQILSVSTFPGGFAYKPKKYSYNGVLLPEIPADVLAEYPYAIIRENNAVSPARYDLFLAKGKFVKSATISRVESADQASGMEMYAVTKDNVLSANEWTFSEHTASGNVGITSNQSLLWANHDIPNGSATATDIYFKGNDPVLV